MRALLLAGGRGANMIPFSETRPKPMIPVAGEYVIKHTLSQLQKAGVRNVDIVCGHKSDLLKKELDSDSIPGMKINFIEQTGSATIGNAILSAKERFVKGEQFFLVYADTLTTANIFSAAYQTHCQNGEPVAAISHTSNSAHYGNVYLGQDALITKLVEKPGKKSGLANYVLAGVFYLHSGIFDYLAKTKGNMEKALKQMISKENLRAALWEHDWLDLAMPWDILSANMAIMSGWNSAVIHKSVTLSGVTVRGSVRIDEGVEINPGAILEGPLYIGANSFIGNDALIRPFTSISANCIIGQSAELKNCVLMQNVNIGRLCFIGDSVVGEGARIGAGCMAINHPIAGGNVKVRIGNKNIDSGLEKLGVLIGDNAYIGASNIIGAGTVVKAGKMIDHNISLPSSRKK